MDPSLALALALLATDYSQTAYTTRHPEQFQEDNLILGHHPSRGKVAAYFVGFGALTTLAHYELPKPYGAISTYVVIGMETDAVAHNLSIHVGFSF